MNISNIINNEKQTIEHIVAKVCDASEREKQFEQDTGAKYPHGSHQSPVFCMKLYVAIVNGSEAANDLMKFYGDFEYRTDLDLDDLIETLDGEKLALIDTRHDIYCEHRDAFELAYAYMQVIAHFSE